MTIDIGEVVARSGVPVSTLHVWERRGLITPVGRAGLRRQYDDDILGRIAMIVTAQRANFTLDEVGRLLAPDAFPQGKAMLADKLVELREQRLELDRAIGSLEHALACEHDRPADCSTFQDLLAHALPVERTNKGGASD